tara:strand:- start:8016 stop:8852 length:837 start_codon:yes stop_codon:yes gene_type:complete
MLKLIECPRDAMQGIKKFIPTDLKIKYINQLLKVGFDTIDIGSFVSEKAVPQLKDTGKILDLLTYDQTISKLLCIVANKRGAVKATLYEQIDYLGFPLSVSEIFQNRNTNKTISQSLYEIEEIHNICINNQMELVIYLSMAFGNPYDELYDPEMVAELSKKLNDLDIRTISLADTIGCSDTNNIKLLFSLLISEYPQIEFGAHFHSKREDSFKKIETAYINGCRRFDSTIKGLGGCPFANNRLVGNIPTEIIVDYFEKELLIDNVEFKKSFEYSNLVF